jgi:hypothetical protein
MSRLRRISDAASRPALLVAALTLVGFAIRLRFAGQSLFADEIATYWVITGHGVGGVISTVHSNAEITPPLYFVLAWLATQISHAPEFVRAPSLVAGTAAIPVVYLLGLRTIGRAGALVGAALVAFSPFMIFYSAEARGYAVMMTLVMLAALAALRAIDGGGRRWWTVYALSSCAAMYTHYTAAFGLATVFVWLVWAHPPARRAALLSNAAAVVGVLPWLSGLINDFTSPTTAILSQLEPLTSETIRISLEHWSVGYPYAYASTTVGALPGVVALVLLGLGVACGLAGVALSRVRAPAPGRARVNRRVVLVVGLAVAAPLGEALVSAFSTNLFGTRNLAVSWPGLALALAALAWAGGPRVRVAAAALVISSFAIGATGFLRPRFQRPDEQAVAHFIDRQASPGDVVIDGIVLSPGPLSALEIAIRRPIKVLRAGQPEERDHPFGIGDRVAPVPDVARQAVSAARGRRIFLVSREAPGGPAARNPLVEQVQAVLGAEYNRVDAARYPGIIGLTVAVYARSASPRR